MADYWVNLHEHNSTSNAGGYFEVVTQYKDYVKYAVDNHIPAICVTNHGNVAQWIKHKELAEEAGLKYIHGIEAYTAMSLDDKSRYHTIIIAKNYDGVKELNRLSSKSFNRKDGHYYYKPRIMFDELVKAVDHGNLYVTTACMAGPLAQAYFNDDTEVRHKWINFAKKYPERVFLEIQPHDNREQAQYNDYLVKLAQQHDLKLIASNDVHALNQYHDKLRKIIKKGKGSQYDNEDEFELWLKDRSEMIQAFQKQDVVPTELVQKALDLTVEIAESVEPFEIDKSHKYPKLYDNPEAEFQKRIKQGLVERGITKLPPEEQKKYAKRVQYEYSVYKHNGAIDYMLSHEDIMNAVKEHGAHFGPGRGSVGGSLIAYLCGQTDLDSLKLGLNFERFMHTERISLADIDVDAFRDNQQWAQQWVLTNDKWHAASILTANTYGLKAAIKAIADGLPRYAGKPQYIQSIRNEIEDEDTIPRSLYEEHRELIDMAKSVVGVIDSFGRHAAGIVIDTNTIDDAMGTMTISGWDYPVTQITMKEIDHNNWVKYDLLGLDNVGLIEKTAELAGIPYPTPDSDFIDFEDEKVWESMRQNNIGVFQMEGDRAGKLLSDMLSPETIKKIRSNEAGKNVKYMDLLSLVNAAQRPSGASYVDKVTHGEFKDNGHPALNEFLAPTLGELVYQEQILTFLTKFCGYTAGEADLIRRGIGKKSKDIMDNEVPKIKPAFIKTMVDKYGDSQEHAQKVADSFIRVFMDAVNYGFSVNHSMAYSYIGYISTWLRYYYPLEWCTAAFEVWQGKQEKIVCVLKFAKSHGIDIKPVRFGKSKGRYFMDRETNSIYEGTATIKGLNEKAGDILYRFGQNKYDHFVDLLIDLYETSVIVDDDGKQHKLYEAYQTMPESVFNDLDDEIKQNVYTHIKNIEKLSGLTKTHMVNLIDLKFFDSFGNSIKLKNVYEEFRKKYKPSNKRYIGKRSKYLDLLKFEIEADDEKRSIVDQLTVELKLIGSCRSYDNTLPANLAYVLDVAKRSGGQKATVYSVKKGVEAQIITSGGSRLMKKGNLIRIEETEMRPVYSFNNGKWDKIPGKKNLVLTKYKILK